MKYAMQFVSLRELNEKIKDFKERMGNFQNVTGHFDGMNGSEARSLLRVLDALGEVEKELQNWEFDDLVCYRHNKITPCLKSQLNDKCENDM